MATTDSERELTASQLKRLISLAEATGLIRGRGGPASIRTLRKWSNPSQGYRAHNGSVIVLRTIKVSGDLVTLEEWCEEFERARVRAGKRQPGVQSRPRKQREAEQRRAKDWLDAHGVK
jgi:hypothetical protein